MPRRLLAIVLPAAVFGIAAGLSLAAAGETAVQRIGREAALRSLKERGACKLAIGLAPAGRDEIEPRVICVAEIVKSRDTLDEDLGCSVVLYDLETASYRAGKSNLRIATNHPCDSNGLARLDPRPFAEHALRDGISPVVLLSDTPMLSSWWEHHLDKARAERAAKSKAAAPAARKAPSRKGGWKYDGKSQFEGI